jgi:membrane protease YdiL (CAAX protease family)
MLSAKPWRTEAVLLLLAGILLSGFLGSLVYQAVRSAQWPVFEASDKFCQFLVGTISLHAVAICLIALFIREHGLDLGTAFGLTGRHLGRTVLLAALAGVMVLPITWYLNHLAFLLLSQIETQPPAQPAVETFRATVSQGQQIVFGVVTIVVAPVAEELLFRGVLYPALRRYARRAFALWGLAVVFAAIHQSDVTFLPLTFLAVMLTLLYEETGSLTAPILVHCIFNSANFFWLMAERQTL